MHVNKKDPMANMNPSKVDYQIPFQMFEKTMQAGYSLQLQLENWKKGENLACMGKQLSFQF